MDKEDLVTLLLNYFRTEMPQFSSVYPNVGYSYLEKRKTLRGYLNLRRPGKLPPDILSMIDQLLDLESEYKNKILVNKLTSTAIPKVGFYVGDITTLVVDAVVNPSNPALLGCFVPDHNCIENRIHSCSGPLLRESCARIIEKLGHEAVVGRSYITYGYHLFSKYVIHSVGPSFRTRPSTLEKESLKNCYRTALMLSIKNNIKTIAFPPLSTGLNGFTSKAAAEIATNAVEEFLNDHPDAPLVVFCVEKEEDINAYSSILGD